MLRKGKKTGSWSLQAADYDVDGTSPLYNIIIIKFTPFNFSQYNTFSQCNTVHL